MIINNNQSNIKDSDQVFYLVTKKHISYRKNGFTAHHSHIIKKNNGTFINKNTGEIISNVKNSKLKIENQQSLIRSYRKLFYTIENYIDAYKNSIMITLGYNNAQTDFKELSHDFDNFMKRLNRYIHKKHPTYNYEYIRINEPYEKPADNGKPKWHVHLILLGIDFLFIDDVQKLWGHGKVYITSYADRSGDSVAQYFCSFLNASEQTNSKEPLDIKRSSKKRRLKYYNSGTDLFSTSRGVKTPKFRRGIFGEIKKEHPGKTINEGSKTIVIDNKVVNRFDYLNQELL
ncbi:replication rep protein [Lactobacillus reuteri]|nr:replication rep protein [Limosilactobacillus reuteri]